MPPDEITFFKSVGMAVQDVATAQAVLAWATEMELGIEVEINCV
jgi:ornithine cyclodeaminase/alanine dehydrogenase-like protein (mu-crystallin family)